MLKLGRNTGHMWSFLSQFGAVSCILFPIGGRDLYPLNAGQRFMIDLLVSSLMADGGLESALDLAFRKELQEVEETKVRVKTTWMITCAHLQLWCSGTPFDQTSSKCLLLWPVCAHASTVSTLKHCMYSRERRSAKRWHCGERVATDCCRIE